MRVGVITFPGTLDDRDAARAVNVGGAIAVALWHADADLKNVDAVILPSPFFNGIVIFSPAVKELVQAVVLLIISIS